MRTYDQAIELFSNDLHYSGVHVKTVDTLEELLRELFGCTAGISWREPIGKCKFLAERLRFYADQLEGNVDED
jgi:hypothetical protein